MNTSIEGITNIFTWMVAGGVAVAIVTNRNSAATISSAFQGFARSLAVTVGSPAAAGHY